MLEAAEIEQAERRWGTPQEIELQAVLDERELELVGGSLRKLRTHDITFFIVEGDELVVIRKPMFPPEAFRAPSGGVHPGEGLEEGARREALEETGLDIRLERYLLRVNATFRAAKEWPGQASLPPAVLDGQEPTAWHWQSHVFLASVNGSRELAPQDTWEIAEARWVTLAELQGPIREVLLASGWSLFRYRVALTDATIALIDEGVGAGRVKT